MKNEKRDEIRQKAREYRKQFYAPGTQHVNDSVIDQENMLTGFAESCLSGEASELLATLQQLRRAWEKYRLNRGWQEAAAMAEITETITSVAAPPVASPQPPRCCICKEIEAHPIHRISALMHKLATRDEDEVINPHRMKHKFEASGGQPARHGKDCPKVEHVGGGWLHDATDDSPYDVDGVSYCGRCHGWMGNPAASGSGTPAAHDLTLEQRHQEPFGTTDIYGSDLDGAIFSEALIPKPKCNCRAMALSGNGPMPQNCSNPSCEYYIGNSGTPATPSTPDAEAFWSEWSRTDAGHTAIMRDAGSEIHNFAYLPRLFAEAYAAPLRQQLQAAQQSLEIVRESSLFNINRAQEAEARAEKAEAALTKINAIRNSIVGMQGFNFSEHAYPLVAALDEAGFKGDEYELAAKNLGTLLERANRAEAELASLKAAGEGWIPCSQQFPNFGELVDVVINGIVQNSPALYGDAGDEGYAWYWLTDSDPAPEKAVSHWRKRPTFTLPPAPAKEGK